MNRRRHANLVPVAALVRWVVVAFFLGTAGLSYVYFKNQMQTTGNEIRSLETQLNTMITQDDTVRAQIDRLSSHSYLERRLAEGFIRLTPITDNSIVRVHLTGGRGANATASADVMDDLQPVSNRVVAQ
jgi:hypothetical protein